MTLNTIDCELVMTAVQFSAPWVEQPARWLPLKCTYVSYAEIPRPITARTSEVTWSHSGCSEGPAGCGAGTSSSGSGSGTAALGAGLVAFDLVGVAETAAAVLADRVFERAFEFAIADVSGDLAVTVRIPA
jgi:hypothetical protein